MEDTKQDQPNDQPLDAQPPLTEDSAPPSDSPRQVEGWFTVQPSLSPALPALRRGAGDQGVDGVISEDRLGLGQIYLQAKRWQSKVSRPEIQAFVGAMHGRAQKGVFITTSEYTKEALEYAKAVQGLRIRLVDGRELASIMVDVGLGVTEGRTYRTYRIDNDFFEEGD